MKRLVSYLMLTGVLLLTICNVYADSVPIELELQKKVLVLKGKPFEPNDSDIVFYQNSDGDEKFKNTWYGSDNSNSYTIYLSDYTKDGIVQKGQYQMMVYVGDTKDSYTLTTQVLTDNDGVLSGTYSSSLGVGKIEYKTPDDVIIKIRIKSDNLIYGFMSDLNYNKNELQLVNCDGYDGFNIESDGNRIVIDNPIAKESIEVGYCRFKKIKSTFSTISLENIQTSNEEGKVVRLSNDLIINEKGETTLKDSNNSINNSNNDANNKQDSTNKDESKKEENSSVKEEVKNPKTGVWDLSVLLIVIIVALLIAIKYTKLGKFFKGITVIMLIILPIKYNALTVPNLNIDTGKLTSLRKYLLTNGGNTKNSEYDYDNDGVVTINDLIFAVIDYSSPKVSLSINEASKLTGTVSGVSEYSEFYIDVYTESNSIVSGVSYCYDENPDCVPKYTWQTSYTIMCDLPGTMYPLSDSNIGELQLSGKKSGKCDSIVKAKIKMPETSTYLCVQACNKENLCDKKCFNNKIKVIGQNTGL